MQVFMGRTYLIAMLVLGLLASALGSGGSPADKTATEADAGSGIGYFGEASSTRPASEVTGLAPGEGITLERSSDGHFYADVEVNGASVEFLVDTGASGIALSRDDARRAGLATSIAMPTVVGEGASGVVHGELVMLDRVTLGSATETQVPAVVLDSGSKSLLGQSFLSKFGSVVINGNRMVLQ